MDSAPGRKQLSHTRIVEVAARAIRRAGFQGLGVADIMKEAGLTHGGFYAHFASRDALMAEALAHAGRESARRLEAAQSEAPGSSEATPTGPSITVVAQDHHYAGLPTSLPVGSRLRLSNAGAEVHQMIVARRVDGVTETWDELLADPDPVGAGLIELAGQLFAAPGQDAIGDIAILQAGEYFAVCFVPT